MCQRVSGPFIDGFHLIGATHRFNDEATDLRSADMSRTYRRLAEISPELGKAAELLCWMWSAERPRIGESFQSRGHAARGRAVGPALHQPGPRHARPDNGRPFR